MVEHGKRVIAIAFAVKLFILQTMNHPHSDLPGYQGQTTIAGIVSDDWRLRCCKACGSLLLRWYDKNLRYSDNKLFRCASIDCEYHNGWYRLDSLTVL
jgi:hypothetical protein